MESKKIINPQPIGISDIKKYYNSNIEQFGAAGYSIEIIVNGKCEKKSSEFQAPKARGGHIIKTIYNSETNTSSITYVFVDIPGINKILAKRFYKKMQHQIDLYNYEQYDEKLKHIQNEQHVLSYALLQKLVQVYEQNKNDLITLEGVRNGWNPHTYVRATMKDGRFVYEILHENYPPYSYSIEVPNGNTIVSFGAYPADGCFFEDEKYNYAEALYELTVSGHTYRSRPAISALKEKETKPDLQSTEFWPSYRMAVFSQLDKFIQKQK